MHSQQAARPTTPGVVASVLAKMLSLPQHTPLCACAGKERGHGTELMHCPKCGQTLKPGKHHVGCVVGKSALRTSSKKKVGGGHLGFTTKSWWNLFLGTHPQLLQWCCVYCVHVCLQGGGVDGNTAGGGGDGGPPEKKKKAKKSKQNEGQPEGQLLMLEGAHQGTQSYQHDGLAPPPLPGQNGWGGYSMPPLQQDNGLPFLPMPSWPPPT
jgi:hypothetical protein